MAKIWADRILAGTRSFSQVPQRYKSEVQAILEELLTSEELEEILSK